MKQHNIYLVSDFTCETLTSISRAIFPNFSSISVKTELWPLVNEKKHIDILINAIKKKPGIVLCTIFDENLQKYLIEQCNLINVECMPVMLDIIKNLEKSLETKMDEKHHKTMAENTANRMEAIEYTLAHDDGQNIETIKNADIIIIGISRTSKSPTSLYLGYRCFRVANIPIVQNIKETKEIIEKIKNKFIVGLTISHDKLIELRENREKTMGTKQKTTPYTDPQKVIEEIQAAQKLFTELSIPTVNVTNSSVEETAAKIIKIYNTWKNK